MIPHTSQLGQSCIVSRGSRLPRVRGDSFPVGKTLTRFPLSRATRVVPFRLQEDGRTEPSPRPNGQPSTTLRSDSSIPEQLHVETFSSQEKLITALRRAKIPLWVMSAGDGDGDVHTARPSPSPRQATSSGRQGARDARQCEHRGPTRDLQTSLHIPKRTRSPVTCSVGLRLISSL